MVVTNDVATRWRVNRVGGSLGAEVVGIDLMSVDRADLPAIEEVVLKHHVVVFRGQDGFTEQGLLDFGRLFGPLREFAGTKDLTKAGGLVMNLTNDPELAPRRIGGTAKRPPLSSLPPTPSFGH